MRFHPVLKTWTSVAALPLLLSACAFLIPDNPSEPRYNTVLGGRRMPQENMRMQGATPPVGGLGPSSSMAAPVTPVALEPAPVEVAELPADEDVPPYRDQLDPFGEAPGVRPDRLLGLLPTQGVKDDAGRALVLQRADDRRADEPPPTEEEHGLSADLHPQPAPRPGSSRPTRALRRATSAGARRRLAPGARPSSETVP